MKKHLAGSQVSVPTILAENIQQLLKRQSELDKRRGFWIVYADKFTRYSGTLNFLFLHVVFFTLWFLANSNHIPGLKVFDPYPYELLTMLMSIDAILLAILVLISQNRVQEDADRRAELDLHVNLLAERETTLILRKLMRIEKALKISIDPQEARLTSQLTEMTDPVDIMKTIEKAVDPNDKK